MSKVKIAFTSCVRYERFPDQPQWLDIENQNPDYLFLLGDNIYMDYGYRFFSKDYKGKPAKYDKELFEETMEQKYRNQWSEPHFNRLFRKMRDRNALFATWDDHDFGWNNSWGNEVKKEIKDISRAKFHQWMEKCSPNYPEIYCHLDIEHARVIFLDNRSYADSPEKTNAKLLGDKQFEFLEEKLNHDKQYTIICAGLTLTHGGDNWAEFSTEYSRFCRLVEGRKDVIFLAGDIHKNKFAPPAPETCLRARRPCYEIISSGLALNYLGLPFKFDNIHNWGLLELDDDEIIVQLFNKRGKNSYRIDGKTWMSNEL